MEFFLYRSIWQLMRPTLLMRLRTRGEVLVAGCSTCLSAQVEQIFMALRMSPANEAPGNTEQIHKDAV